MTGIGHIKRGQKEPAHTQAPESQHMHSPYTVRRIDASHVLLSDGWVVRDISWQPPLLSCPLAASVTTKSMTPQSPPFLPHEKGSKFRSENVKAHVKPTTRKPQDCPPLIRKDAATYVLRAEVSTIIVHTVPQPRKIVDTNY